MRVKNGLSQIEEYYTTRINHTQDLAKILEETNIKYREQSIEAVNQSTEYHKKYEESKRRLIDLVGPDFEDL